MVGLRAETETCIGGKSDALHLECTEILVSVGSSCGKIPCKQLDNGFTAQGKLLGLSYRFEINHSGRE